MEVTLLQRPVSWRYGSPSNRSQSRSAYMATGLCWPSSTVAMHCSSSERWQRLVTGNTRDAAIDAYTALEIYLSHVPARARYHREGGASPRSCARRWRLFQSTQNVRLGRHLRSLA